MLNQGLQLERQNLEIHFEESKSGSLTCSLQGKYLHSKYNPVIEGERFAESLQADFSPLCVFILEPSLSYCAEYLKKRFPEAEICAVRFCRDFSESDAKWNHVFYIQDALPLGENIFNKLGEEKLCSSLVADWNPSKQVFLEQNFLAWQEIKNAIVKSRSVITTRAYFSKRWFKNSIIFASKISKPIILEKGSQSILISASGPSLSSSLPFIKENRSSFFLIALSSSFMPLCKNGILPDIVISSDGGYWAKKHLAFSGSKDTAFAIEAEGSLPKNILSQKQLLALCYDDGLEKDLLEAIGCPYMLSERNGTVAGTALAFAHSLTTGNIYICGFDQGPSPSFQHTQPNALENDNAKNDFRLKNSETRMTVSRFNSEQALEIYRNWFITNSPFFSKRVFRLSDDYKYEYTLGKIKEINWKDFKKIENDSKKTKEILIKSEKINLNEEERQYKIRMKIKALSESQKFKSEVFPMDSILIKRELSDEKKRRLESNLKEKIADFLKECEKLI